MLTYVTAWYPTRTDVRRDDYLATFRRLVDTGVPLILFLDPAEPDLPVPPSVRIVRRSLVSFLPEGLAVRLPSHRNEGKDTQAFLTLMLHKLWFVSEALAYTDSEHLAWIDFRIFHIVRHTALAQQKLRALVTRSFPGLTKLLAPGCWSSPPSPDPFAMICWRFCGGFFLGPRACIQPALHRQMELVYAHLPALTWEVNYWAMMEEHFERYPADHDDTMLMNVPYSPRILRPGASTYYVDGGRYRRLRVGHAIETALFAAFCDTYDEGVLVIPKTDMVVATPEYRRMKQSVPWDDPAISDEATVPRGTVLCLDTSRGIDRTGVLHYPLDDETFAQGLVFDTPLPAWETRKSVAIWRGGTSGVERPTVRQRVVAALRDHPHADVKFVRGGWPQNDADLEDRDCGDRISFEDHTRYKYMFVLDGNGIASSAQWVFATGCVPIIVSHPDTHSWLSDVLTPWVHYVPIAYDLSDLSQTLQWLVDTEDAARQIADAALVAGRTILSPAAQQAYLIRAMHATRDHQLC